MNDEFNDEMGGSRFRIYIARGKVLLFIMAFELRSGVFAYFDKHKKKSLWVMDITDMTMRHNSHFR